MKINFEARIVVIHDNLPSAFRARELVAGMIGELPPALRLNTGFWKFQWLDRTRVGRAACQEAVAADLMIVAGAADELPDHVEEWLDHCLAERAGKALVLVALPDGVPEPYGVMSPLSAAVQQLAQRWQVSFLTSEGAGQSPDAIHRMAPPPARPARVLPEMWKRKEAETLVLEPAATTSSMNGVL